MTMNETNLNGSITMAVTPAARLLDEPLRIRLRGARDAGLPCAPACSTRQW